MAEIPSNIFTFDVKEQEYGIINSIKQNEEGVINIEEIMTPELRSGKWKTCQINEELFVIGTESLIQDFMNIQDFYETVGHYQDERYTREEFQIVSDTIYKKKKEMDLSTKFISANDLHHIGDYNLNNLLEFTVESDEQEKFSNTKQAKLASSFSNPYGVDRIINTGSKFDGISYVYNIPWDYTVQAVESIIGDIVGFIITKHEKNEFNPFELLNIHYLNQPTEEGD